MNTLEPLCNFEQSKMLKELSFMEPTFNYYSFSISNEWLEIVEDELEASNDKCNIIDRPTISLAKNWLYEKYGIWIETKVYKTGFWCEGWDKKLDSCLGSSNNPNPHTAETDCLTKVLKKLTSEQQVLRN